MFYQSLKEHRRWNPAFEKRVQSSPPGPFVLSPCLAVCERSLESTSFIDHPVLNLSSTSFIHERNSSMLSATRVSDVTPSLVELTV